MQVSYRRNTTRQCESFKIVFTIIAPDSLIQPIQPQEFQIHEKLCGILESREVQIQNVT